MSQAEHEVYSITSAQESRHEDISLRTRNYLISMSIRVVCFAGAVFVEGWMRWAMLIAAAVLPYFAVLYANTGQENKNYQASYFEEHEQSLPFNMTKGLHR
ncbi:MAG: DUF3099 domain-containing protein [Micrococcaceae bacterium]